MEYFRIHAKGWLFWAVLGIGLIIALGLRCQIMSGVSNEVEVNRNGLFKRLIVEEDGQGLVEYT